MKKKILFWMMDNPGAILVIGVVLVAISVWSEIYSKRTPHVTHDQPLATITAGKPGDQVVIEGAVGTSGTGPLSNLLTVIEPCPEEADRAALDKVWPLLGNVDARSLKALDAVDQTVTCLREWAAAMQEPCHKKAVEHWIDFYAKQFAGARLALADKGNYETAGERSAREFEEAQARAQAWEKKNPFPPMPQCAPGTGKIKKAAPAVAPAGRPFQDGDVDINRLYSDCKGDLIGYYFNERWNCVGPATVFQDMPKMVVAP